MILNTVFPVFLIIAIGYVAGVKGIVDSSGGKTLNNFVFYIALPALLFNATATAPIEQLLNGPYIAVVVGGIGICFGIAYVCSRFIFKKSISATAIYSMGAAYGTTGYMGIPLVIALFGQEAALPAAIATLLHNIPVIFLVILLCSERGANIGSIIKPIIKNPLTIAVAAGFVCSAANLHVPTAVHTLGDLLANASGATALFAIGLGFVNKTIHTEKSTASSSLVTIQLVLKLIIHPIVTFMLFTFVFEIDPLLEKVALIMAALPVGAGVYVFAQQYKEEEILTLKSIIVSISLSIISISILISLVAS